jgi:hypothetical protein
MSTKPTPEIVPVIWPFEPEWYHCRGHLTREEFADALMEHAVLRLREGADPRQCWGSLEYNPLTFSMRFFDAPDPDGKRFPVTMIPAEDCTE